ncbi:MAG: tetratricopeptide repeat protein [Acidobacteriia bacterium]|nr:tetratricopeptide repeat protein [Terriglobia bacterium]
MKQKARSSAPQPTNKLTTRPTLVQRFSRPEWLIILAATVCDLNSWGHQFLMDDLSYIVLNKTLQNPSQVLQIFTSPFSHAQAGLYRPLTALTLAINVWIGGLHPDGFHLVNRLLHILICLCFFWTARLLIPKPLWAAPFSTLLFAVHPAQVEAITYITGRSDALVTLFFIAALYYFTRLRLSEHWAIRPYVLSMVFYSLALLSKESAITWVGVALLAEFVFFSRSDPREFVKQLRRQFKTVYAGYLLASLTFIGIAFSVLKSVGAATIPYQDNPLAHAAISVRLMTALKVLFQNLGLFFWPRSFSSDYSFDQIPLLTRWNSAAALTVLALAVAFTAILIWSYKRAPSLFFGLGFFGITYSLVSNIVIPIGTIRADRLMYLPAVGLCLPIGMALARVHEAVHGKITRAVFWGLFGVLLVVLTARTIFRNRDWADALTLSIHDIQVSPRSGKLQNNLGALYFQTNQYSLAMEHYRIAESIMPDSPSLLTNIGISLKQQGQIDEAVTYLRRAVSLAPQDTRARNVLGVASQKQGDLSGAIEAFDTVLEQDPGNADAHFGRAYVLHKQGKTDAAIREYLRTLEIDPSNQGARNNLNLLLQNPPEPNSPQNLPANPGPRQPPNQ